MARKPGWVFTQSQFGDLGSPEAVRKALARQVAFGKICRARGLYGLPRRDPQLGPLVPSVEATVEALKGRDAIRLQPQGAYAAQHGHPGVAPAPLPGGRTTPQRTYTDRDTEAT